MFTRKEPGDEPTSEYARFLRTAERGLQLVHLFVAAATVILGVVFMFAIGGGRGHLAARLTVAVAAVFIVGAIDTQATRLAQRRRPLLAPDPRWYRRFEVWSALGMMAAAALLLGLAWFLP